jgi:hypothetical protein
LVFAIPDASSREIFDDHIHADSFEAAVAGIAGLGARLVEIDLVPFVAVARML